MLDFEEVFEIKLRKILEEIFELKTEIFTIVGLWANIFFSMLLIPMIYEKYNSVAGAPLTFIIIVTGPFISMPITYVLLNLYIGRFQQKLKLKTKIVLYLLNIGTSITLTITSFNI